MLNLINPIRIVFFEHIDLNIRSCRSEVPSVTTKTAPSEMPDRLLAYQQHYEELKMILDQTFDQITIADGNGRFLMVSKNCEEVFGVPSESFLGITARELEERGIFSNSSTVKVLQSNKTETVVQTTLSGRRLVVTGIPMHDENGNLFRIINIARDITEIEKLNEQLKSTEDILGWYRGELLRTKVLAEGFVRGNNPEMDKIINLINHVADTEVTILLLGETGVGKGVFAEMIHQISRRREGPLIPVNCGAIPKDLMESELFGYVSGAFTGASAKGKKGMFEIANNGTVFLDEIGEMPMDLQVKLLHVLQGNKIYKVGSSTPTEVNARVIAATNRDLKKLVEEGGFREDLYYRLNVVPIQIPSLRQRVGDIPLFVRHFLEKFNSKYGTDRQMSQSAYDLLSAHDWPGNVRELENAVERLVITCQETVITDLHVREVVNPGANKAFSLQGIVPLKQATLQLEKQLLEMAYRKYKTTRKIGEVLELDQSTVVKKINRLKEEGQWNP